MANESAEASFAVAEAVKLADTDVVAAYPITPQTHIVERLSEMVADGELDAKFICVESEHSAMSACLGSSAVGARTFTATAGQGLELMHEVLFCGGIHAAADCHGGCRPRAVRPAECVGRSIRCHGHARLRLDSVFRGKRPGSPLT